MNPSRLCAMLGIAALSISTAADAAIHRVSPGESIQAAIDGAAPGDTILVDPGVYEETGNTLYGLRITTDDLRLIGRVDADAGDAGKVRLVQHGTQETGIYAAPDGCDYKDTECPDVLEGFNVRGFTVEDFPQNGIQTRWVDGFRFVGNESSNNLNNGIYPTLSANGLVRDNVSYGSLDTSMWVAGSENVRVIGNEVYGSPIGLEISVSNNVVVKKNKIHGNTVGVGLFHPNAAGNPPIPVMEDWVIENNHIYDNNLPNPAPPGSFQAGLPAGGGVLLLGVSNHTIGKNKIEGNDFFGIGVLGWCTSQLAAGDPDRYCENVPPIADPSANDNRIYSNELLGNGLNPPADNPVGFLASDVIHLQIPAFGEDAVGNCFERNKPRREFSFFSYPPLFRLPTDGC